MSEPLLELRGISKRWPSFQLQEVGLALPGGMIMGLMGANGAGKTTLLKILMGLVPPTAGEVRFKGQDLFAAGPELRQRIAFVPDEPRFVPELRLRSLKEAHARFYRDWDDPRWRQLMEDFGLDPAAKAGQLSLGMRTKFALTLALARNAELLVLDEPTTGLDPEFRRDLLQRLTRLIQDESRSMLFSTHITSDLENRVDLVSFMQQGRLVFTLDQDTLHAQWVLVKGGLELLDDEVRRSFAGLRTTPHGFEGLSAEGEAVRQRFAGQALVERASLEDIVVLMGKGVAHA
jgi:ABC-2 type transport system ATP-binding protein